MPINIPQIESDDHTERETRGRNKRRADFNFRISAPRIPIHRPAPQISVTSMPSATSFMHLTGMGHAKINRQLTRQQEQAHRQEREREAQARRERENEERINRALDPVMQKVKFMDEHAFNRQATENGWTQVTWWSQWYAEWQRGEQEFKAIVRGELHRVLKEFQQRDETTVTMVDGKMIWNGDSESRNREIRWRHNKLTEVIQKLQNIMDQKIRQLTVRASQLEREHWERSLEMVIKEFEKEYDGRDASGNWQDDWAPEYREYHIARIKEENEWDFFQMETQGISREPRLQRLRELYQQAEVKARPRILREQAAREAARERARKEREQRLEKHRQYIAEKAAMEKRLWASIDQLEQSKRQSAENEARARVEREIVSFEATISYKNPSGLPGLNKLHSGPVNVITGEYHTRNIDVILNEIFPLKIGRKYSSQNLDTREFGSGWKISGVPTLIPSLDGSTLYAVDADDLVTVYTQDPRDANRWIPTPERNPHINNVNNVGNTLNAAITKQVSHGEVRYILPGSNGDQRIFKVHQLVMHQLAKNGFVPKERIYLEKWQDKDENYYAFELGNDDRNSDYGKLKTITSNTRKQIHFQYDQEGRIVKMTTDEKGDIMEVTDDEDLTEATSEDHIHYRYSEDGDLIEVSRSENNGDKRTQVAYDYEQTQKTIDGKQLTFSTHRIIREKELEGRILEIDYNEQGRVSAQRAINGATSTPVRTTFTYESFQTSDKIASGVTIIKDADNSEMRLEYTDGLITKFTDPMGQSIRHEWYQSGDTSPGAYPRALKQTTDKRGLITKHKYDSKGNVVEKTTVGDLTGNGISDTATTRYAYNDKNLLTSVVDPMGNEVAVFYENSSHPQLPTRIERRFQGQVVFDIRNTYMAQGLLQKQTIAGGTPGETIVEYTYNEQGLLTNRKQIAGTSNPDVLTQFEYNPEGELIKQVDDFGISLHNHDPLKKQIRIERQNKANQLIDGQVVHYNDNGELTQIDQFNPGSTGRPYATTYKHDHLGNLIEVKRPESHPIKMTYDAMGRMLTRSYQDETDSLKVHTEKFTYGPGGEIATYINPQGTETKYFYTTDGKLRRQENPDGRVQEWRYHLDGRLKKEILSNGSYRETNYNNADRTITNTLKDSTGKILDQVSYGLDRRGNVISYTDGQGKTFARQYDGLNRLTAEIAPPEKPGEPQRRTTIAYNGNTVTLTNTQGEKQTHTKDALGRTTNILVQDAQNKKVSETKYAYAPDKITVTETKGSVTTTTFLKNIVLLLLRWGKQETAINDAKLAVPMIGVSMGLGGIGTAAKKLGWKGVGNTFDKWSSNWLQNAADRLGATNEGPMGRVFDTMIHGATGYARPFMGHNQQFLADWTAGNLPIRIVYAPDSIQVRDMMESPNVKKAIDEFYAKGAPPEHPFGHSTPKAFWDTIANSSTRNLKSTAMQVGGYDGATITNNGDGTMTIRIPNTAGARSFFYHMVPNLPGKTGPMHNVEQVFEWTMPIDPTRLSQPTNK